MYQLVVFVFSEKQMFLYKRTNIHIFLENKNIQKKSHRLVCELVDFLLYVEAFL